MRLDGNDVIRWGVAGVCSVVCHVAVIMLFMWTGSSSTPPPPLEPSPISDVGQQPETVETQPGLEQPAPTGGVPSETASAPAPTTPRVSSSSRTPPPSTTRPAPGAVKTRAYTVKAGDKLIHLARDCGSTPAEIAKLNGVDEKTMANLKVGQVIKLKASE